MVSTCFDTIITVSIFQSRVNQSLIKEQLHIMIERYSLPEMAAIWSAAHKTDKWLQVELLACEGWAREGIIPQEAIEKIREARYNAQRMQEIEQQTHHDVISFLRSI